MLTAGYRKSPLVLYSLFSVIKGVWWTYLRITALDDSYSLLILKL